MKDSKGFEAFLTCLGGIALVFVGLPLAYVIDGFVLKVLWGWFVVPKFGLPTLTIAWAIGLSTTIGLITHQYVPSKENDAAGSWTYMFLAPLFALLIGAIIHYWFA